MIYRYQPTSLTTISVNHSFIKQTTQSIEPESTELPETNRKMPTEQPKPSFYPKGFRLKCLCGRIHEWKELSKVSVCPFCGLIVKGEVDSNGILNLILTKGVVGKINLKKGGNK